MPVEHVYVVDRIEGEGSRRVAVLVGDDSSIVEVSKGLLGPNAVEGAVLRVAWSADGAPNWRSAIRDLAEEDRRKNEAALRLRKFSAADPGGDVKL